MRLECAGQGAGCVAGAGADVDAAGADAGLMGTHGCTTAFCPGSAVGPAGRIIPAGQGASSSVGLTSGGSGGACTGPLAATLSFEPGHA